LEHKLATPYLQIRLDEVPSTQDLARQVLEDLPVVVVAPRQTRGRGRNDAEWITAPRAVAASLALRVPSSEKRPISLMAGLAVIRCLGTVKLKWPNDVMANGDKAGGILVERADETVVVGLGLNLYWPEAPDGMGVIYRSDPGPNRHLEIATLWAAEFLAMMDRQGWPLDDYREACTSLGREIVWEPAGHGRAVDILETGELVVDTDAGHVSLNSGAVSHVRG
jgi:BirA family transcriptional regulator, biotin operon repressor / biotin---[acetyl-CoA-carboxylase] ligase